MKKENISLEQFCKENNREDLLLEWDYKKNGDIKPNQITSKSSKRVWWQCKEGHIFETSVINRTTIGLGCPICAGKKIKEYNKNHQK